MIALGEYNNMEIFSRASIQTWENTNMQTYKRVCDIILFYTEENTGIQTCELQTYEHVIIRECKNVRI